MKTKKVKLTPPDRKRCQTLVPNGNTFMTIGGIPGHERCTNKPTVIAYEVKPQADGLRGSMSLCDRCKVKFLEQYGDSYATFKAIAPKARS